MSLDVKTEKQLRGASLLNPWEVAWVLFRYADNQHHYSLILKPTGIELAKKDCEICLLSQESVSLYTDSNPKYETGNWNNLYIKAINNTITVGVNGSKVFSFVDDKMSEKLKNGQMGLFSNDASVSFDNIYVNKFE
jgi:hypothetical protein